MESSDAFVKLREEILQHAVPLLESDSVPADDRFRLSLQIAQTNGTIEAYEKALAVAEQLDEDSKLLAYLDLLSDVDYVIQEKTEATTPTLAQASTPQARGEDQDEEQTLQSADDTGSQRQ